MTRVLLLTPPLTQLNTPYPATAYLKGFLREVGRGEDVTQADPALALVLRLLSPEGLDQVRGVLKAIPESRRTRAIWHFLDRFTEIRRVIAPAVRFLQGKDPTLAHRIASRDFLPEGPRFSTALPEDLAYAFGALGAQDQATHLATLLIDDIADAVREGVDPRFELSRYGEKLAASQSSFDPLLSALESSERTLLDQWLDEITRGLIVEHKPDVLGLTAPFPGNVYGALRIAREAKRSCPDLTVILGGGYVNTELRELADPRFFDYVDYLTLDDGERPLLTVLEHLEGTRWREGLYRVMVREEGRVRLIQTTDAHDIPSRDAGTPDYAGLPLGDYLSVLEVLNPMHRLWSDGRWNKLTLAHGCYWKKCSFCDTSLDYIGRYDPTPAAKVVDRMERLARETGQTGFHFVDEAAPPAMLRGVSEEILRRGLTFTWWGNIRFEKSFTPELTQLMAHAGCIAVTGGLEVASDRLLALMQKGVNVEQVAQVSRAFSQSGVLVHAYLMYGFPTQTVQETVDALERVRQLFNEGCIQSAYWHRFSVTAHSPIGRDPGRYGITLDPEAPVGEPGRFARNDLRFNDPTGVDHDALGAGLRLALQNYLGGAGLDRDVRGWFTTIKVPRAQVAPDLIARSLRAQSTTPGLVTRPLSAKAELKKISK